MDIECNSGSVSRRNGLISTTGSKDYKTDDERLQLSAAIACAATLSFKADSKGFTEVPKRG